ncbi:MAG: hypothetical protein Q7S04_02980 [Candidatus Moranbacteria bacterium]|nr:hypothetical protein [Candidatus Moranbacteria bacterium]
MESTLFITPSRPLDEISRLIGNGLKKNGLIEKGNPRRANTRFKLSENDYFVGFSWCYETIPDSVVILLEISKYYEEEERKKDTPSKLTKPEIINYAKSFKKYIESEQLPISEVKIKQFKLSKSLSVEYELGNKIVSPSKRGALHNPFELRALPESIRVYWPAGSLNESDRACRMLADSLIRFGVRGARMFPELYNNQTLPLPDNDSFECIIIIPNIEDELAKPLIVELKKRPRGIHIFDFDDNGNQYKFDNLAAGILYNSGSELWRVHGLDQNNSIYVGIDLGHDPKLRKSKICMTFIDKNGRELSEHRYIAEDLPLNEKQQLIGILTDKLEKIQKENGFENVIIHKDGRILENHDTLYYTLKQKFGSVSLIEVVKSNSAFILDPESKMGDIFDFGNFILLQTLPFNHLGKCTEPIKIKILKSDLDRMFLIDNVFKLSKAFCGDSLYADKKLPITTHIADRFSSFQTGKTLQSFNIAKKWIK